MSHQKDPCQLGLFSEAAVYCIEVIHLQTTDIIDAMALSAAAYRNVQPASPFETLMMISDQASDVQGYLRKRDGCLTVTFRGSTTYKDWKTNLSFNKKVVPYGNHGSKIRTHSGFLTAYKSAAIRDTIHSVVSEDIDRIKISGHSQGAALAILCGVDLQYNFPDKDYEVVLFGAPRVGNRAFQKSYDKRLFKTVRIENGNDWVTKLPFAFIGYRHVGAAVHIGTPRIPLIFSHRAHNIKFYYKNFLKFAWHSF